MNTQHTSETLAGDFLYPKNRLLAVSGIAALLCFIMLVYPSRHVEAKKTFLNIAGEEISSADFHDDSMDINFEEDLFFEIDEPLNEDHVAFDLPEEAPGTSDSGEITATDMAADDGIRTVKVKSGDTLSKLFAEVGLGNSLMVNILDQVPEAKRFTRLKIGQELLFTLTDEGNLQELSSTVSQLETIHLTRNEDNDGYSFHSDTKDTYTEQISATGNITSTLQAATSEAGLSYRLMLDLSNIFSHQIDFARDIRKGDSFTVVYEQNKLGNKVISTGNILAARFTNRGKTHTVVRYTDKKGNSGYYDSTGASTQRAFIRTPVDGSRISSRFNPGRKHPVTGKVRPHRGVDYAAPSGTPIKSTGSGKVVFAGKKGGYGNTVIIQHGSRYRTLYAHLRGFSKGLAKGTEVKQGQIVGYVGSTGLSTGPHLHYEFMVNGTHVDPLSNTLPAADPIAKSELPRFKQQTGSWLAMLGQEKTQVALAPAE